jgi:hypothetical protein
MVLVMAKRKAGPCERQPKKLGGKLENNSREPRDLTKARQSDSLTSLLTRSHGNMKKGDVELMMLMSENESDCHRSVPQRFRD